MSVLRRAGHGRLKKALVFLGVFSVLGIGYHLISAATLERSFATSLLTFPDRMIPFVPEMVIIYLSVYLFWLPPILSKNVSLGHFWKIMVAITLAFIATFLGHLLIPSSYPRPQISDVVAETDWANFIIKRFLHWADPPNNTFPSSHVVTAMILMVMTRKRFKLWLYAMYCLWGIAIIISTLTVKQHYVVDVASAILVALAVNYVVNKYFFRLTRDPYSKW